MSFAGLSLTVIVLAATFALLVVLGYTRQRRALLAAAVAFYPATLVYQNFPWYTATTASAGLGLWAGCFLVSFWALRDRVDPAPWPRLGRGVAAVALAVALFAEMVTLYASVLPLSDFFELPGWLALAADVAPILPIALALVSFF